MYMGCHEFFYADNSLLANWCICKEDSEYMILWDLSVAILLTITEPTHDTASVMIPVPLQRLTWQWTCILYFCLISDNVFVCRAVQTWRMKDHPPQVFRGSSGAPWNLFPLGSVPGELEAISPEEEVISSIPDFPCNAHHLVATIFANVTAPQIVPFIVDPGNSNRRNVAIIISPGGGWDGLMWEVEGVDIARWLNTHGISAFVLKYRVPRRPWLDNSLGSMAAQMDAQRAISMVRARAEEFSLKSFRIGYMGFSAGGVLGITVSSSKGRKYTPFDAIDSFSYRPDFQILIYGGPHQYDPSWFNETQAAMQPPTFFASAVDDPCQKPDRIVLGFSRFVRLGVRPAEIHVYSDGSHGFGRCSEQYLTKWYSACSWTGHALAFIDRLLANMTDS